MLSLNSKERNALVSRAIYAAREVDRDAAEDYLKMARAYGFIQLKQLAKVNRILEQAGLAPISAVSLVRPDTLIRRERRLAQRQACA